MTIIAVPKGRILEDLMPLLKRLDIEIDPDFFDPSSRALQFPTNHPDVSFVRVRSFDVATFVAFGAAQIGICGNDVLSEFDYSELYAPLDLGIGACRLSLAAAEDDQEAKDLTRYSHLRVATKYPFLTKRFFAVRGIQAECIKLNGAIELAPKLGMCRYIVDLVSTGSTLKANGLVEQDVILPVTSRLVINRTALKTRSREMENWIARFSEACEEVCHG